MAETPSLAGCTVQLRNLSASSDAIIAGLAATEYYKLIEQHFFLCDYQIYPG
jgi:hypothetical protein